MKREKSDPPKLPPKSTVVWSNGIPYYHPSKVRVFSLFFLSIWCWICLLFQMQDNKTFLSMINNVLHTDGFYFATDYDLTHTLQRLANTSPEFQEMSLLERVRYIF